MAAPMAPGPGQVVVEEEPASVPGADDHPLLLDKVLNRIFECSSLSDQDLINMREVCRKWRVGATKAYSKRLSVDLRGDADSVARMFVFLDLIQEPFANMPFPTKLRIDSDFFYRQGVMLKTVQGYFENFLHIVAPTLEKIEFAVSSSLDFEAKFNPFNATMEFPELKTCVFSLNYGICGRMSTEYFLQVCAMVLEGSPGLERVKISSNLKYNRNDDEENEAETPAELKLDESLLSRVPRSVKELILEKPLLQGTAQIMSKLILPVLETLEIEPTDSHELDHAEFCGIFNGCHGSLQDLKINRYIGGVEFPVMPRLKKLTLNIGVYGYSFCAIEKDHRIRPFTELFPAVTELHIPGMGSLVILNSLFPEGFHAPMVESCSFPDIATIKPETTLNLARGFTGLKKLNISPVRPLQSLPIIFGKMGGLEEMFIQFKSNSKRTCGDSALTGIPRDVCKTIRAAKNWNVDLSEVKTAPGLSDLTNLKTLKMERFTERQLFLTDVSGYFGILKNESLTKFSACRFEMTSECWMKIKARFGDNSIHEPDILAEPLAIMLESRNNFTGLPVADDEVSDSEFEDYDYDYPWRQSCHLPDPGFSSEEYDYNDDDDDDNYPEQNWDAE